jgi:hypothetical protein
MESDVTQHLREVRDTLLEEPVSPRVETPADIGEHYCRYVAQTVADRVSDETDVRVVQDGGAGHAHVWLVSDGRHYDAECVEGVDDYHDLPFFQRHPEAAIHVEPGGADQRQIRHRGGEPLYPDL